MSTVARLAAVSLDTDDPKPVSEFYRKYLDLEVFFESPDFVALKGGAILLTFQRVEQHIRPTWPGGEHPKQVHLEFAVEHLETAERRALELGASKAEAQPSPDKWLVLTDPAGHPFCITTMIPEV